MFSEHSKLPVYDLLKKKIRHADVGIELEVEGKYLPDHYPVNTTWSAKSEGSLQSGMEYVSKPIKAAEVATQVQALAKFLSECGMGPYKCQIKPSYRCSTHIHVNMLGEMVGDFLGFVVIFTMFEPVLLSLCGPQRDGNLFCLSNYDTGDAISSFDRLCSTIHHARDYGFSYDRGKYAALNLGRMIDLGTAEARCFPLSLDGDVVQKWVNWLMAMKDLARSQPDKTYRELWKLVRQNPQWYAVKIFGSDAYSVPGLSSLVDFGTETAYELTKVLKRWYSNKEEPKKKKTRAKKIDPGIQPVIIDDFSTFTPTPGGAGTFHTNTWASATAWTASSAAAPASQPYPEEDNGF